ncbi:MAG: hypothetical protein RLY30_1561 [Pseudomonadota bacterium]|jgi:hypothetical protein
MRNLNRPDGQALIEVLVVSGVFLACLGLIRSIQSWSEGRADASEAIRLHTERCRQSPGNCTLDGLNALFPGTGLVRNYEANLQRAQAQGSGDWSFQLRAMASGSAEQIFSLPDGNPLRAIRADIEPPRQSASLGSGVESLSLSVIPHDWRSISRQSAEDRIREGSEPVKSLAAAIEAAHAPSLLVLMPATDFLGLDSNTAAIRTRFHRLDPLAPAQSLGEIPQ